MQPQVSQLPEVAVIYHPHFAYPTPPGCYDEPYEYFFDASTMQAVSMLALSNYFGLLFQLDRDAEFRWRGTKIGIQDASVPLEVQWKDAFGNVLSDVVSNTVGDRATINTQLYAVGSGFGGNFGGIAVPWDEEIVCPPGSVIESNWFRPYNSAVTIPSMVSLLGVKRYYFGEPTK